VGLALLAGAVVCFVAGVVQLAAGEAEGTGDLRRMEVPGRAELTIEDTGTYTVFYQSTEYVDTGVCAYAGGSGAGQVEVECDAAPLAAAGEPQIRSVGGELLPLQRADGGSIGGVGTGAGLERFVAVWSVDLAEAGTYELQLDDAPLGTRDLAVGWDGPPAPASGFILLALGPLLGLAGLVVAIVGVVRLLRSGSGGRPS
jgi:hypothetical protein